MKRRRISSRGTKPNQNNNPPKKPHKIPKQIMTSKEDEVKLTDTKEDAKRILGHIRETVCIEKADQRLILLRK